MADQRGSIVFSVFLWIFVILLVIWFLGWVAFHIVAGLWHLFLVIAIIALVLHFVRPRRGYR